LVSNNEHYHLVLGGLGYPLLKPWRRRVVKVARAVGLVHALLYVVVGKTSLWQLHGTLRWPLPAQTEGDIEAAENIFHFHFYTLLSTLTTYMTQTTINDEYRH
jgi:hypothetical protein